MTDPRKDALEALRTLEQNPPDAYDELQSVQYDCACFVRDHFQTIRAALHPSPVPSAEVAEAIVRLSPSNTFTYSDSDYNMVDDIEILITAAAASTAMAAENDILKKHHEEHHAKEKAFVAENEGLREALKECIEVLDSPALSGLTTFAAVHGFEYRGPSVDLEKIKDIAAHGDVK